MHHKKLVRDFFAKMWKVKYISILLIRQSVKWKKADFSSIVVINVICKSQKCTYNIYWVFLLYYLLESFWVWKVLTIQDSCRIPNFYINTKWYHEGILTSGNSYLLTWYMLSSSIILGFDNNLENYALCRKSLLQKCWKNQKLWHKRSTMSRMGK